MSILTSQLLLLFSLPSPIQSLSYVPRCHWKSIRFPDETGAQSVLTFYTCMKQMYARYAAGTRQLRPTVAKI